MTSAKGDVVFYSQRCQYCTELLGLIVNRGLRDRFVLICVDTNIQRLPDFVDRVPLIYRPPSGCIITEDDVFAYVDSLAPVAHKPQAQQPPQPEAPAEVLPYSLQQSANYSDTFSFLGETGGEIEGPSKKNYTMLGMEDRMVPMPSDDDVGKSKFDTKILDDYMKSRDSDTAIFKQKMNTGLQPLVR